MADRFVDDRGEILDILPGPIDCVTRIFTRSGATRGNHRHKATTQWTYIVSGRLLIVTEPIIGEIHAQVYGPDDMACEEPGVTHAWKALEDTVCLVFTRGPRSGAQYESDTQRLEVPLLT